MNSREIISTDYPPIYGQYIKSLGEVDLIDILNSSLEELITTLKDLSTEKVAFRYDEGKWTIKELLQHIIDTERIMSYRALRFSRLDDIDLAGYDENWYTNHSNGADRDLASLLNEFTHLRKSVIAMLEGFKKEMMLRTGSIDGNKITVGSLAFIIAGHQVHHLRIIKDRYL
jgi:uncharacterized damage-inducible protein DinB